MVSSDDEAAAQEITRRISDARARHFWDSGRRAGLRFADVHLPHAEALLKACAENDEIRERVEAWRREPGRYPAWDVAYFFLPGTVWADALPKPVCWTKQFAYFGEDPENGITGHFWSSDDPSVFSDSSWLSEFSKGMKEASQGFACAPSERGL